MRFIFLHRVLPFSELTFWIGFWHLLQRSTKILTRFLSFAMATAFVSMSTTLKGPTHFPIDASLQVRTSSPTFTELSAAAGTLVLSAVFRRAQAIFLSIFCLPLCRASIRLLQFEKSQNQTGILGIISKTEIVCTSFIVPTVSLLALIGNCSKISPSVGGFSKGLFQTCHEGKCGCLPASPTSLKTKHQHLYGPFQLRKATMLILHFETRFLGPEQLFQNSAHMQQPI